MKKPLFFALLLLYSLLVKGQNGGIRILPEAGISVPIGDFEAVNVFAKQGIQAGLHLEKMWGNIGLGLYGGFDKNNIQFEDLLPANTGTPLIKSENSIQDYWMQYRAGIGPVLKLVDISKKINIELTSKVGLAKFSYPDFGKFVELGAPVNQVYTLYQTRNEEIEKKVNPMVLSALRLNIRVTKKIDLSLAGNYLHVQNVLHSYSYLDAGFNPDMSDQELIEALRTAPTVEEVRKCHFNTIGATIGISLNLGGKDNKEDGKMDPPVPDYPVNGAIITAEEADSLTLEWRSEQPKTAKANYNLWLYSVSESEDKPDSLVFETKVKKTQRLELPEDVDLESGATYRWKVQAVDDRRLKACPAGCYSVAATFEVARIGGGNEAVLRSTLDAGYYTLSKGYLNFKYDEEYANNGNELEFNIYDKTRVVVISNTSPGATVNVTYKDNRCRLNIKALNPSLPKGFYVLEVKDKKGEISMLRFKL